MTGSDFARCFDFSAQIVYFPVRHHSPACSYHINKVIEEYKPECVLIEGPEDGCSLIPYLGSENVTPPLCLYSSYDDKDGRISDAKEKYRAYYPFLSYSPELAAIKCACEKSIPAFFIDMPYGLQLVQYGTKDNTRSFGDDLGQEYYRLAAEKTGSRSFAEFWENGFETRGLELSSADFVKSVFTLGIAMRELSPAEPLNAGREAYMRRNIDKYTKQYNRILVVAGAFHISGLADNTEKIEFKKYSRASSAMYLMPYSFAEADSRSGYGAGIPFPAFYSSVWEKIIKNKDNPYEETAVEFIVKTSRHARKGQPVSIPDETQALYMAKELAALRGRSQPGAFELIDGVRSAFVKGDITTAAASELDFLFRQMTGLGAGEINISDDNAQIVPPCVVDFRVQCRKFRINLGTIAPQNAILDIVKNKNHYEKSCFLHRLEFLGTGFCIQEKGPDYVNDNDTSLVREHWKIRYNTAVEAHLTDLSVFGGNIGAICLYKLRECFENAQCADDAGKLLLETYVTGFSQNAADYIPNAAEIIRNDTDFLSQCGFMKHINRLLTLQKLTFGDADDSILYMLGVSFRTALSRIETMSDTTGEAEQAICSGIRIMNALTADYPEQCPREEFLDEIAKATDGLRTSPRIFGVCLSICAKAKRISREDYCNTITSYMTTAESSAAAAFINGIISVGRDIIFTSMPVLLSIDSAFAAMDKEEFIAALPQFRCAFTDFLPSETARISKSIANHYNADEKELFGSMTYSSDEIVRAGILDRKAREIMEKWGL